MSKNPEVKIGINHQPMKEYTERGKTNSNIVYMNNGDSFEILLYNPLKKTVGVRIELNGQLLTNSNIVLYPGQSFWLDGDPDKHKKFHFTEYEVEANKENLEAIADNGKVKIEFFKETTPIPNISSTPPFYYKYPNYDNTPRVNPYWGISGNSGAVDINNGDITLNQFYYQTMTGNNNNLIDMSDGRATLDALGNMKEVTGRVDFKGQSDQQFNEVDITFEFSPSHTFNFRILPKAKYVYATDIKIHCSKPGCGRRKRKNDIFCPQCGEKL